MAMDPVQQTLMQQQSGSAGGEGFGQFFVEGARLGLSGRQVAVQEHQEKRLQAEQNTMLPLHAEQTRMQTANLGIAALTNLRKEIANTQVNAAMPEILQLQIDYARAPDGFKNDALYQKATNLAARYPSAFREDMPGGKLMGQVQGAWFQEAQWNRNIQRFKELEQQTGRKVSTMNPQTGGFTLDNPPDPPATIATGREVARLKAIVGDAFSSPEAKQKAQLELESIAEQQPGGTTFETVDPDGRRTIMNIGGRGNKTAAATPGALTPTQSGNLKLQSDKLIDVGGRVGELIDIADTVFGPVAATKSFVVDRVLSNLNPNLIEGQRVEGRNKAGLVIEGLIRSLSEGQGQLSNADIKRLTDKFPELNSPEELIESPARAKLILGGIQKEMARDAYEKSRTLGIPPDPRALRMMDPLTIIREFEEKRITQDQMLDAINNNKHQADVDRFLKAK